MPSSLSSSSVSVKTESAYGDRDETADEVESDENGDEPEDDDPAAVAAEEAEAAAAADSEEADDIAFVASDLVLPAAVPSAELEARQSTTMGTPRCEICRTQKQRCTFENASGKCDKCYRQGYECRIVDSVNARLGRRLKSSSATLAKSNKRGPRGVRQILKCDWCRKTNRTCLPKKRSWPRKCNNCEVNGLACSPMTRGKRAIVAATAPSDKKRPAAQPSQQESVPEVYTSGVLAPEFSEGSDESDESADSDASIPAVLPPVRKRKRQDGSAGDGDGGGGGGSNAELEAARLREAILRMEDEYQEVLRTMQSQHKQELDAMRTKYELATEELAVVTRNHERRLDDLIYIMKNNERRADEIIQALKNK